MGLFGGCDVNGSSVAACTSQMHAQLTCGQNVLKVVHQLKKVCQAQTKMAGCKHSVLTTCTFCM